MRGNSTREANLRSWIAEATRRNSLPAQPSTPSGQRDVDDRPLAERPRNVALTIKKILTLPARRQPGGRRGKSGKLDSMTELNYSPRDENENPVEETTATGSISPYQNYPVGASLPSQGTAAPLSNQRFLNHELSRQQQLINGMRR